MKHLTYFFFSLLSVDSLLIFPRVCLPHPLLSGLPDVPTQAYPHFTCPCSWVKPDWHWVYLHGPSLHPRTCLWVILWAALVLRRMSWGCPTWCPPETMVASPLFCWWSPCAWFLLCLILRLELPHELLVLSPLGNPSPLVRMGWFLTLKLPFLPSDHTLPQIKAIGIFFWFLYVLFIWQKPCLFTWKYLITPQTHAATAFLNHDEKMPSPLGAGPLAHLLTSCRYPGCFPQCLAEGWFSAGSHSSVSLQKAAMPHQANPEIGLFVCLFVSRAWNFK